MSSAIMQNPFLMNWACFQKLFKFNSFIPQMLFIRILLQMMQLCIQKVRACSMCRLMLMESLLFHHLRGTTIVNIYCATRQASQSGGSLDGMALPLLHLQLLPSACGKSQHESRWKHRYRMHVDCNHAWLSSDAVFDAWCAPCDEGCQSYVSKINDILSDSVDSYREFYI